MHRFRSKSSIYRFRVVALLICAKCILIPVTIGLLAYSMFVLDRGLMMIAMGFGALSVLMVLLQWLIAGRTSCPLCMTPVLAKKACTKHRHARSLLGSHRLRVALTVLFKNTFRCPYCHEPTVLEVRERFR